MDLACIPGMFQSDALSQVMLGLIGYIGFCVMVFASRYMKGDKRYPLFFLEMLAMIACVVGMVMSDHLWTLFLSTCLSQALLIRLMIHHPHWKEARAAGILAAQNYGWAALFMGAAFVMLYAITGQTSVSLITNICWTSPAMLVALFLLLLAAMAQSALWPFHRWLLSSLSSPTPVSAMMHAGLINGGGFLLVRFSGLYIQEQRIMHLIFIVGIVSALLGTLWKLIQTDVKRMLACSTLGQMGFMFVQCGLGLFPLAIAHLLWHGLFKAYLFLASGSAAQEQRMVVDQPLEAGHLLWALLFGLLASLAFSYITNKSWFSGDTTVLFMVLVSLAGTQVALSILQGGSWKNRAVACIMSLSLALVYGASTQAVLWFLGPMLGYAPQALNLLYMSGIALLVLPWICFFYIRHRLKTMDSPPWLLKAYVQAVNASQPAPQTITAHRNHYQYS